ncbi:MAG: YdcF family protein [Chloroflexota bacterium]
MPRLRFLVALGLLLLHLVVNHQWWLGAMGDYLVAREELRPSDVIIVLAGNSIYRSQHGAVLYQRGLAPRVIVSNEPVRTHGFDSTWLELHRKGLVKLDIADAAIVPIPAVSGSTHEEALHSRDIMLREGWQTAILVTDPFHTRRALLTFQSVFSPAGLTVIPAPAEGSKYQTDGWWRDPDRGIRVIQEYIKLPYYLVKRQI